MPTMSDIEKEHNVTQSEEVIQIQEQMPEEQSQGYTDTSIISS